MKRGVVLSLLLAGACTRKVTEVPVAPSPVSAPAPAVVAAGPRPALDAFLSAIRVPDLQALAGAWGDKNGAVRDSRVMKRDDMEQRELVLIRCLGHDKYRVLSESPAADNERILQVELTSGTQTRVVDFFTAKAPDRWLVRYAQPLCPAK